VAEVVTGAVVVVVAGEVVVVRTAVEVVVGAVFGEQAQTRSEKSAIGRSSRAVSTRPE
jgi:hypothetical protein